MYKCIKHVYLTLWTHRLNVIFSVQYSHVLNILDRVAPESYTIFHDGLISIISHMSSTTTTTTTLSRDSGPTAAAGAQPLLVALDEAVELGLPVHDVAVLPRVELQLPFPFRIADIGWRRV